MDGTRLDVRLKPDTKALIQQAASLRNQSVTQFVIATLSEEAGKVLAAHNRTALSDRDRDRFLQLLDAPPKPNGALQQAAASYRKRAGT